MTNEMKLLTALCDALGFEVEKTDNILRIYDHESYGDNGELKENAMPVRQVNDVEYKLTKKPVKISSNGSRRCVICNMESTILLTDFCDNLLCGGRLK